MTDPALTQEQVLAVEHMEAVFIKACPGAGKTRVIVERLSHLAPGLGPRRGVAVLSFTNSAVDEFTSRCRATGMNQLLVHPHFIGTFDAFVRHFFVVAQGIPGCAIRPVVVDSWETIDIRLSGNRAYRGPGTISLDDFDAVTGHIDPSRIGIATLSAHVQQHRLAYESVARARRQTLRNAGYLSSADCRVEAQNRIQGAAMSAAIGAAIAGRFFEVIIDEAQDCNELDISLLNWLRGHGVRVTIVCDPDQAIYAFRNGSPALLSTLAATYTNANQRTLTGNFRSSGPICELAATLRSVADVDTPLGDAAEINHPIELLTYSGRVSGRIGSAFIERMALLGIGSLEGIVLAHGRSVSLASAGNNISPSPLGTTKIEALSHAIGTFWAPAASGQARDSAVRSVEKILLQYMGHLQEGEHPERALSRSGLDRRQLRRQALEFLMAVPKHCADVAADKAAWVACARTEISRLGLPIAPGETVNGFFRVPPPATDWTQHLQVPEITELKASTIHDAKGRAYRAVCVVVPPDRAPRNRTSLLLDAWQNRLDSEAKRVIYVGVTRARAFVALAIPESAYEQVHALLDANEVPHLRHEIGN